MPDLLNTLKADLLYSENGRGEMLSKILDNVYDFPKKTTLRDCVKEKKTKETYC